MSVTKEKKQAIVQEYRRSPEDSGSPEVQVAIITSRVQELTGHMRLHPKDYASRRGLLALVSRRRTLLDYLVSGAAPRLPQTPLFAHLLDRRLAIRFKSL
ncbi:MAG: 30S ribosomal protein S15 [Planctomycetes bacterium]|nr:30S ribosomal protein S15 [Planctomycetota bacterium]